MRVLLVFAHPEPRSFNGVLRDTVVDTIRGLGGETRVSDLYEMGFNPVAGRHDFEHAIEEAGFFNYPEHQQRAHLGETFSGELSLEMQKLEWADVLILQFPLWWYSMPAILKGWIDRVFAYGFAYGGGRWYDEGVFAGKRAMLMVTAGGPSTAYEPDGIQGDMNAILFPIHHGILQFTGFAVTTPFVAYAADYETAEGKREVLARLRARLDGMGGETTLEMPRIADYDEVHRRRK